MTAPITTTTTPARTTPADGLASMLAYLTRVLKTPTIGRCWAELAAQARDENWSHEDYLAAVLQRQVAERESAGTTMRIRTAHFPAVKTLEDFDFKAQPSIDPRLVRELATGRFIAQAENVLLFGPPGVGKTHLAIGLGRAAVETGHSVLFTNATALLAALAKAESEGALRDKLNYFAKPKLLVIDELGYLPFEKRCAHLFFQLVSRRYETGAMLITSNRSVAEWGTVFADPVVATAILDRLLHHSHVLTIRGDSYRLRAKRKSGLIKPLAGDGPPVGSASLRPVTGETNIQPRP